MKTAFKRTLMSAIILSLAILSLSSCKKDKIKDPPNADKFPLTNFSVKINKSTTTSTYVLYEYELKNISGQNFVWTGAGVRYSIYIKFTVTTTDGTIYSEDRLISDLEAGKTEAREVLINHATGKTIDLSKTKYELFYQE